MRSAKRTILIAMLILAGFVPVCYGQEDAVLSGRELLRAVRDSSGRRGEKLPTVTELLDKYAQALDSTSSFIEDYEKTTEGSFRGSRGANTEKYCSRGQLRYDKQRIYKYEYRWGNWASLTFTEDKPHYIISVVNSEMNYQNIKGGDRRGKVFRRPRPQGQNITLYAHFGVSYIGGYIGSDDRLDAILRKADHVSVRKKTEKVDDSECFVIEADTKYGRYTIWLDTEHGFHPAKVLYESGEGDYCYRHLMAKGGTANEYLKNVRFEKIDGVWVPMEADSGQDIRVADGTFSAGTWHYKRTKIVLNPDHDKLGSFADPLLEDPNNDPELTNGARVRLKNLSTKFTWQNGKVVDAKGREVDLKALELKDPVSIMGKPLPSIVQLGAKLDSADVQGKRVLVCFWDMNQRPSRNCVRQIKNKAQGLSTKGVYVILVHTEPVDKDKLNQWLRKNAVAMPVCRVTGNAKQLRQEWNVQSLPWLILTDKEGIVGAEGFGIKELDEKVGGLSNAKP